MGGESPVVELYDSNGNPLSVQNGAAIPANTPALMFAGSDGTNSRYILIDSSGREIVVGAGVAGTPAGGVITIQGVSGGMVVPVSGTVTSNQGTANTLANAWPIEVTDGNNILGTVSHPFQVNVDGYVQTNPNVIVTNFPATQAVTQSTSPWVVSASGNFNNASIGTIAAAVPSSTTFVGGEVQALQSGLISGDLYPLSLTTAGLLRVDGSNVIQPVSGTVSSNQGAPNTLVNAWPVELTDGYGHLFGEPNNPIYASVNQGAPNSLSNAWPQEITDGVNGPVAVKPPSTAAIATDAALVVAFSPNNPITITPSSVEGTDSLGQILPITAVLLNGSNHLSVIDVFSNNKLDTLAIGIEDLNSTLSNQLDVNINNQATTIGILYGSNNQYMNISLASLTSSSAQASQVIDNTITSYEDVYLFFKITTAAAGVSTTGYVNVYGYGSVDGGSNYPEGITGANASVTLTSPPNLFLIAQINANTNAATKTMGPVSFCRMYGVDRLPAKWGVVVVNQTGATFNATASNFAVIYQGINGQLQ